jgi:hypothetical protein
MAAPCYWNGGLSSILIEVPVPSQVHEQMLFSNKLIE